MKKLLFVLPFLFFMNAHATELHVDGVIVNMPCQLKKADTLSATTVEYKCDANNISFSLQIVKDTVKRDYNGFMKEITSKTKGTVEDAKDKIINGKTIKYFVSNYTIDKAGYISEYYLYVDNGINYIMCATRKKENWQRVDVQIYLNSLIIVH